jgi:O-antigen/teichoic acid export membrane protein
MIRVKLSPDRLRLLASLTFNFVAKAPGLLAAFVILPLISRSLGTSSYGEFLSALALGSAFCLPFGGINAVGRRLLAGAYGAGDRAAQANTFVTTIGLSAAVTLLALVILALSSGRSWTSPVFLFVASLPVISGFLNVFDNLRASYNEHYVTAALQLAFQLAIYGAILIIGLPRGGIALAGLTMQSAYGLASLMTFLLLVIRRPFLLRGRLTAPGSIIGPALGVMMADGAMALLLNLSVYWLSYSHQEDLAAWFGTLVRLFQSFLSPVMLIFFPLTTYISMRWGGMTTQRQRLLHKLFILTGFGYGVIVGGAMALFGPLYVDHMFRLNVRGDRFDVLALSLFLGAIIAQKTYTMLLYAVSEARFVSYGTAVMSSLAIAVAAVLSLRLTPVGVIDTLFIAVGIGVPLVLLVGDARYRRAI